MYAQQMYVSGGAPIGFLAFSSPCLVDKLIITLLILNVRHRPGCENASHTCL